MENVNKYIERGFLAKNKQNRFGWIRQFTKASPIAKNRHCFEEFLPGKGHLEYVLNIMRK